MTLKTKDVLKILVKQVGSLFTCGKARRSMDHNYSPPGVIQLREAFTGQRDPKDWVIEVTDFDSEVIFDL